MGYVGQGDSKAHQLAGLVLDLSASKANGGTLKGVNNPASAIWKDLSGNENDGVLNGFAYTEKSGWTDGLNFDGVNDSISIDNVNSYSEMTIEGKIVTSDNIVIQQPICGMWNGVGNYYFLVDIYASSLRFSVSTGGNASGATTIIFPIDVNLEYYFVGTYKNGAMTFTVNLVKKTSSTTTIIKVSTSKFTIGKKGDASICGKLEIKLLRYYNRPLTDAEILQNYNAGTLIVDVPLPIPNRTIKYLKIFDRFHNILDEINDYNGLKYGWTLNGLGKAQFSIGLESIKCIQENFQFRNHIEIWEGSKCIWGGQLIDRTFNDGKLDLSLYGYLSLLDKRRLRAKSYANMPYGSLYTGLLADINAIEATGVILGTIASGSLKTQRLVTNSDFLLPKLQDYCSDSNYDIDVDVNRKFNFYLRKGKIKADYLMEYGGDADNIIVAPSLGQSGLNIANSVYSEVINDAIVLTSIAEDSTSKGLYGLQESVFSGNDSIVLQNTLDNNTVSELQRVGYPTNSIQLKIKDSTLCPFDNIEVGDSIPVSLKPYWNFKVTLRILEMTHNEDDGTRDLVVGETLYRPAPPKIKIYRK